MSATRPISHRLPMIALLPLFFSLPAVAQSDIDLPPISGDIPPIKIAIPPAKHGGSNPEMAVELIDVLRADLEYTGFFDLVDPRLYELAQWDASGKPIPDSWIEIGADAVTQLEIDVRGGRIDLAARVHDNASASLLLGRRYGGKTDLVRLVAHQLADDIVKQFTGADGVAMTRMTFVSVHGNGKEVYLMDYDGARIRRLTSTGTVNLTPSWSPDGNSLAYVSFRNRTPAVYVMSSEGKLEDVPTVQAVLSLSPEWSPDGRQMAYSADTAGDGNTELFLLDRRNGRNRRLTNHPLIDTAPAFSPNGREIAFTSDRSGTPQIYVMDAEGLNVRRVTWEGSYNDSAAWSPDGDRMAYVSRIGGKFELHVMDLTTEKTYRLPDQRGNNENPRWSPDGRHLVFSSDRYGTYDIYTVRRDGTHLRRLTRGIDAQTPDWSR